MKAAARHGLKPRKIYNREAPHLARQIGQYAHAKQYKRMMKALRTLRSRLARVMRDVERQFESVADTGRNPLPELIGRTRRILSQKQKDRNKLYALHAPEIECRAKRQGSYAVQIWRQGVNYDNPQGRARDRRAFGAEQSVRRPSMIPCKSTPTAMNLARAAPYWTSWSKWSNARSWRACAVIGLRRSHSVNEVIRPLLKNLNERPFQKLPGCRANTFAEWTRRHCSRC